MNTESARLNRLKATVAALAGHEWLRASDGERDFLEVRPAPGEPPVAIARFDGAASPEEIDLIAGALDNTRFLLGLVDRAIIASRRASLAPAGEAGNLAAPPAGRPANTGVEWPDASSASGECLGGVDGWSPPSVAAQATAQGRGASARTGGGTDVPPKQDKNYSAEAAMKCAEPAFRVFLEERHGLERPLTEERVAQRLRSILAVSSRRELNDDDRAAARWRMLVTEFTEWRRGR